MKNTGCIFFMLSRSSISYALPTFLRIQNGLTTCSDSFFIGRSSFICFVEIKTRSSTPKSTSLVVGLLVYRRWRSYTIAICLRAYSQISLRCKKGRGLILPIKRYLGFVSSLEEKRVTFPVEAFGR